MLQPGLEDQSYTTRAGLFIVCRPVRKGVFHRPSHAFKPNANRLERSRVRIPIGFDQVARSYRSRRDFFRQLSFTAAFFSMPGLFGEELARRTPWVEEDPFYPSKLLLDNDNDLIIM